MHVAEGRHLPDPEAAHDLGQPHRTRVELAARVLAGLDVSAGDRVGVYLDKRIETIAALFGTSLAGGVFVPIATGPGLFDTLTRISNTPNQAASYRIVTDDETREEEEATAREIDERLRSQNFLVSLVESGRAALENAATGINVLILFLLMMSILTSLVGSIGLTGTMGMNVLERTREIGVMRAIGAVDREIVKSVVVEGMVIGLISFAVASVLSFPISFVLLRIISQAMMGTIMPLEITMVGFVIWLGVVVVLSVVASMWPARGASRLTIREVLAYE